MLDTYDMVIKKKPCINVEQMSPMMSPFPDYLHLLNPLAAGSLHHHCNNLSFCLGLPLLSTPLSSPCSQIGSP